MAHPMKISVITCTLNSERYIDRAIHSVDSQTYPFVEHVFVDGGSSDSTRQKISELAGALLFEDSGSGIAAAMNIGAAEASGDILAYLHSDDYYLSEHILEEVVNIFQYEKCEWLYGRIINDIEGRIERPKFSVSNYSKARLARRNFIPHPATFVRKDVFHRIGGFSEKFRYAMDYDLWLKLAESSAPRFFDKEVAAFRRHPESLSTANPLATLEEDYHVRKQFYGGRPLHLLESYIRYRYRRRKISQAIKN